MLDGPVPSADPVFRLPRKLERQQNFQDQAHHATALYIVSCDRIDPMPMRWCITVSNPTGIFLCGDSFIPTHKQRIGDPPRQPALRRFPATRRC